MKFGTFVFFICAISAALKCACAADADADAFVRAKKHLQSTYEPERAAALRVLVAIRTVDAARTALDYFQEQTNPDTVDLHDCVPLLAVLPPDELFKITQQKNADRYGHLSRYASQALALCDPEKVLGMVSELAKKPDEASRRSASELLFNFTSRVNMTSAQHDVHQIMAAEYSWVHAHSPDAHGRAKAAEFAPLTEELARGYMHDPDEHVRKVIPDALFTNLGVPKYPWSQALFFEMARDPDEVLRSSAVSLITQLYRYWGDKPKAEITAIMKAALDTDRSSRKRALDYFADNFNADVMPVIEKLTALPDPFVAEAAFQAMVKGKSPRSADLALAATQSPLYETRRTGMRLLAELDDPRAAAVAAQLASDTNWDVRNEASRLLSKSGSVQKATLAAATVLRGKGSGLSDVVRRSLILDPQQRLDELERTYKSLDPAQRMELIQMIRPVGTDSLEDQFLINRLKDPAAAVRRTALQNLSALSDVLYGHSVPRTEGAAEAVEMLNDPDRSVSLAAARLLKNLPYRSLIPLIAPKMLDNTDDATNADTAVREFVENDPTVLLRCLKDKNVSVRHTALRAVRAWQWDKPDMCVAILSSVESIYDLPAGAPSTGDSIPLILDLVAREPIRLSACFALIARIEDERADAALKQAARSNDRAIRWAALDAMVLRGDESDATLDHALARLLTADENARSSQMNFPVLSPRLLERLDTFNGLCKLERLAKLRSELQRKMADLAIRGEPIR